jgi:hypothetical protein
LADLNIQRMERNSPSEPSLVVLRLGPQARCFLTRDAGAQKIKLAATGFVRSQRQWKNFPGRLPATFAASASESFPVTNADAGIRVPRYANGEKRASFLRCGLHVELGLQEY